MKFFLLLATVLLVGLHEFGSCQDVDEDLLINVKAEPRTCMKVGLMCKTCTQLVRCLRKDTGELVESDPITCNPTFPCDDLAGGCIVNGVCRVGPFICPRTQTMDPIDFPDPYDCRRYHTCTGRHDEPKTCADNTAWDPEMGDCRRTGDLCSDYPVPLCTDEGQKGTISGTKFSYKCFLGYEDGIDVLYPRLDYNSTML